MRKRRRIIHVCCILALLLLGLACFTRPPSPSGRYVADSRIGIEGDFYWEFANGKVALVYEGGRDETFGTYGRTPEGWCWTNDHGGGSTVFRLRCSWWQLRCFDETELQVGTMRRRVIPVLRPQWVPDWIQ